MSNRRGRGGKRRPIMVPIEGKWEDEWVEETYGKVKPSTGSGLSAAPFFYFGRGEGRFIPQYRRVCCSSGKRDREGCFEKRETKM